MVYKRILVFLGVAFVLYFLIFHSTESVGLVRDAFSGVNAAAGKLAALIRALFR